MKTELPVPIAGFFQAHNSRKTDSFLDLFTEDAVVSDEAHEYRLSPTAAVPPLRRS
jgi:hypothetical protein